MGISIWKKYDGWQFYLHFFRIFVMSFHKIHNNRIDRFIFIIIHSENWIFIERRQSTVTVRVLHQFISSKGKLSYSIASSTEPISTIIITNIVSQTQTLIILIKKWNWSSRLPFVANLGFSFIECARSFRSVIILCAYFMRHFISLQRI